jgi:hypothetical protein
MNMVQIKELFRRKDFLLLAVILIIFIFGIVYFLISINQESLMEKYISELVDKGLKVDAAREYKALADSIKFSASKRGNLYYLAANMYREAADYQSALPLYIKAKVYNPSVAQDIDMRIVECLEYLGKQYDAVKTMYEATALTSSGRGKKFKGRVVARIGRREIYAEELEERIRMLPPEMQKDYGRKDKKIEFLKQYVAEELLLDSAYRRGLDKQAWFTQQVDEFKRQVLLNRMLEEEILSKVKVTSQELKLYYEAHKEEFKSPDGKRTLPFDEVKGKIESILRKEKIEELQKEYFAKLLAAEKVELYEDAIE